MSAGDWVLVVCLSGLGMYVVTACRTISRNTRAKRAALAAECRGGQEESDVPEFQEVEGLDPRRVVARAQWSREELGVELAKLVCSRRGIDPVGMGYRWTVDFSPDGQILRYRVEVLENEREAWRG